MTRADQETLVEIIELPRFRTSQTALHRLRLHIRLRLLLWILLVILVQFLGHFIDETLIMFGMLQVAFRQNPVPGGSRIPRQSDIFFIDLIGRAANTHIGAVAVKILDAGIDAPAVMLAAIMAVSSATAIVTTAGSAAAVTATLMTSGILIMSHAVLFFSSIRLFIIPSHLPDRINQPVVQQRICCDRQDQEQFVAHGTRNPQVSL